MNEVVERTTIEKRSQAGRPKSTEKKRQILKAASCLFLQQGFSATSMDNVAKEANVSKQTVYSHFKNKDALFVATIAMKCREYRMDEEGIMQSGKSLHDVLIMVGEQFVSLLHDEEVVAMYRVIIGEVSTNTHVAELFYEAGPRQALQVLIDYFANQKQVQLAANKWQYLAMVFFNMLKGTHHMTSLMGLPGLLTPAQQKQFVARVVADFEVILESHSQQTVA